MPAMTPLAAGPARESLQGMNLRGRVLTGSSSRAIDSPPMHERILDRVSGWGHARRSHPEPARQADRQASSAQAAEAPDACLDGRGHKRARLGHCLPGTTDEREREAFVTV